MRRLLTALLLAFTLAGCSANRSPATAPTWVPQPRPGVPALSVTSYRLDGAVRFVLNKTSNEPESLGYREGGWMFQLFLNTDNAANRQSYDGWEWMLECRGDSVSVWLTDRKGWPGPPVGWVAVRNHPRAVSFTVPLEWIEDDGWLNWKLYTYEVYRRPDGRLTSRFAESYAGATVRGAPARLP